MIDWICDSLGLPYLEERADGLFMNGVARDLTGGERPADLRRALQLLSGGTADHELESATARAQAGEQVAVTLPDGQQVLLAPGDGEVKAVHVQQGQNVSIGETIIELD